MQIRIVEVVDNFDLTETGLIKVVDETTSKGDTHEPYAIYYTSPYYAKHEGGMIAIPEIGTRVLICKPENDYNWYYMSTIVNSSPAMAKADPNTLLKDRKIIHDKEIYRARYKPEGITVQSPEGNEVTLRDSHNPRYFNIKAGLKSGSGKRIEANDSPNIDAVIMRNEHNDYIRINANSNGANSSRSIDAECLGNVKLTSREGNMDLLVEDGRELNISNTSTGSQRISEKDTSPGNINVISLWGDINISVEKSKTGSIFITVKGANSHIVLQSEGTVDIAGKKGVNITSDEGNVIVKGKTIQLN